MKKALYFLIPCILVSLFFTSCGKEEEESFDESLLIGKWVSGTLFYRYDSDGTGGTWDTDDDVTEEEAQPFTWTLEKSTLTHIHIMEEMGGNVPRVYTVKELTAEKLRYVDDFGKEYSFDKVYD